MARLPSATPEVIKHTAPLLFGTLVNWWLYGVLCVQTCKQSHFKFECSIDDDPCTDVYSYNFPDDKRTIKAVTYFVFLLETVQTILTAADVYYWFIEGYGVLERLQESHFAPIDIPLIDAVISLIVQEYFCYRIWTLSRRPWLCAVIAIAVQSLVVGRYAVSKVALYVCTPVVIMLWSIPSALVDILIAGSMVLLVRDLTPFLLSDITYSIGFAIVEPTPFRYISLHKPYFYAHLTPSHLKASVAVASFALYVAFPKEIYYTFTYSNTLLVSLNNRIYFRDRPLAITVDTEHAISSDNSRRFAVTSPFTPGQPPTNTTDEGIKLHSISHPMHLRQGKGDEASFSSGQRVDTISFDDALYGHIYVAHRLKDDLVEALTKQSNHADSPEIAFSQTWPRTERRC
ncbi:hypothetical protein BGW80DRAFT_1247690 [Lactifluus volemus]|nr:hypothetical protein BGW80DRAFT_1247690 [Lactifluus volemus]